MQSVYIGIEEEKWMTIVSPDEEKIYQTREKKFRDEMDDGRENILKCSSRIWMNFDV
jgi:hypothetical protein